MIRKLSVFLGACICLLMSSCSDDSGSNSSSSNLAGKWDLTKFEYQSKANPALVYDLIQNGMTLTMTIQDNGAYVGSGSYLGYPYTFNGNMNEEDGEIDDGDASTEISLSGNLLTIVDQDGAWDFGNGSEPATITQIYQRQ